MHPSSRGKPGPRRSPERGGRGARRAAVPGPPEAASTLGPWPDPPAGAIAALATLLAAALLWVVFGPHRIGDYWAESDFYGGYLEGARGILAGRLDPSRYAVVGPVYEMLLAAAGLVVKDWFLAAQLLSVLAAVFTLLLWHRLLAARADGTLALVAALLVAANPYFFRYGYSATTDAAALALQAAALCLAFASRSRRSALGAGLLAGLAFLTRYNGGVLLPALALGVGLDRRRPRPGASATLLLAGFAVPALAWIAFSVTRGVPPSFQLHHVIAYEVFARSRGMTWDDYQEKLQPGFRSLWDVIARDPRAVFGHLLFNAGDHLRLDAAEVLGWPVAIAAAVGLAVAAALPGLRFLLPIAAAGMLLFLSLVPVAHGGRYSMPLVPVAAALAAVPFTRARFLGRGRAAAWLGLLLLAATVGLSIAASVRLQVHDLGQLPTEVLELAGPLRRAAAPGDRIIARKPQIAYYGGLVQVPFPFATDLPGLAAAARQARARWLFFSLYEARTRPELAFLLDTSGTVPGLAARAVTREHPAVLYEIGPAFGAAPDWFGNDTLRTVHAARAQLFIAPDDLRALRTLAAFAMLRGRQAEARAYLERAAAVDPADAETRRLLEETALPPGNDEPGRGPGGP